MNEILCSQTGLRVNPSSVALGKLLNPSVPQFPPLQDGDNISILFIALL